MDRNTSTQTAAAPDGPGALGTWKAQAMRLRRHPLARVVFLAVLGIVLGLVWPVPGSSTPAGTAPPGIGAVPSPVLEADLADLLATSRWGAPAQGNAPTAAPEEDENALNPELAAIGFVGVTAAGADLAVLLASPDGRIVRVLPGDALPDGRFLAAVTDNAVTLEDADGEREVLVLFPRLSGADASPEADGLPEPGGDGPGPDAGDPQNPAPPAN